MYTKPTLLLDAAKCRVNIKKMAQKAKKNKIVFRPHFKTHQSLEIGKWFREEGVTKITVSSVDMAKYFAQDGWQDITIAFPVNILEINEINELAEAITLNVLLESPEVTKLLDHKLAHKVNAFVKINIGNNRAGLEPNNLKGISEVIEQIATSKHIEFKGFLGHAGNSYNCRSKDEILKVHFNSISHLVKLKESFKNDYPELQLSAGDTPTCAVAEDFSKVDEIRPGVFVFYDAIMLNIGCCTIDQIATTIVCPVVAIHKEKNEIIIYGGRVHLASDILTENDGRQIYGYVIEDNGNGKKAIVQGASIKKLSQEHGIISAPGEFINKISVGDMLEIIPAHICTASNLYDHYTTIKGEKINRFRF